MLEFLCEQSYSAVMLRVSLRREEWKFSVATLVVLV